MSRPDSLSPPLSAKRILAVCIGGLGDTILFSPVFKALRSRYPKAHIELLLASPLARLAFTPAKEIDRLIVANTASPFLAAKAAALLPFSFRSRLSGGFDIGVFATGLNTNFIALLKTLAGIRRVLCAPQPPEYDTYLSCNVALASSFDDTVREHDVFFPFTEQAIEEAERELESHNIHDTSRMLAVYPSRELPHRPRWQLWKLANVIKLLKGKGLISKAVLIGSEEERAEWQAADSEVMIDANLAGRLSLLAIGALFSKCTLALGNDGGIMHIAGAVDCPLVVLMASTPISYRPAGKHVRAVQSALARQFSYPREAKNRLDPTEFTKSISVEDVFQACLQALEAMKRQNT